LDGLEPLSDLQCEIQTVAGVRASAAADGGVLVLLCAREIALTRLPKVNLATGRRNLNAGDKCPLPSRAAGKPKDLCRIPPGMIAASSCATCGGVDLQQVNTLLRVKMRNEA
jgi:hypothetical protein